MIDAGSAFSAKRRLVRPVRQARTFEAEQPDVHALMPLPNFVPGYNQTRIIAAAEVIHSFVAGRPMWPTVDCALHITRIVDACMESSRLGRRVDIPLA